MMEGLLLSPAVAADRRRREPKTFIVSLEEKSIQLLSVTIASPLYIPGDHMIKTPNTCNEEPSYKLWRHLFLYHGHWQRRAGLWPSKTLIINWGFTYYLILYGLKRDRH